MWNWQKHAKAFDLELRYSKRSKVACRPAILLETGRCCQRAAITMDGDMRKKREASGGVTAGSSADRAALGWNRATVPPDCGARLVETLGDSLIFSQSHCVDRMVTRAHSPGGEVFLEVIEHGSWLEASMQLALPESGDLETFKLGRWAVLYLATLFPDWAGVRSWWGQAIRFAVQTRQPAVQWLGCHWVVCRYDSSANVLELQVMTY
jgi:hypothetical protein